MKVLFLLLTTVLVLAASVRAAEAFGDPTGTAAQAPVRDGAFVVLASETIGRDFIASSFTGNGQGRNECESIVAGEMAKGGFDVSEGPADAAGRTKVQEFKTVVGRYKDVSSLPSFTAAKAASMIADGARAMVACGVAVDRGRVAGAKFEHCAKAKCKAVDIASKRRVATSDGAACAKSDDKSTSVQAVIKRICADVGSSIASEMAKVYPAREAAR